MKFFIDTNIIVDFILNRKPFVDTATEIFNKAAVKKITLYTSSHSIATAHYLSKKNFDEKELREVLNDFLDLVTVVPVSLEVIKKSLRSQHKDFEDAIQIFCAGEIKNLTGIITRNIKDFSTSEIAVYSPDEVVGRLMS